MDPFSQLDLESFFSSEAPCWLLPQMSFSPGLIGTTYFFSFLYIFPTFLLVFTWLLHDAVSVQGYDAITTCYFMAETLIFYNSGEDSVKTLVSTYIPVPSFK